MSSEIKTPTHRLMPRDHVCLTWITLQYAIRLDQLQRLLFRHTPEEDRYKLKPGVDYLSLDRTYEIINKWLTLGLIEKDAILHRDKLWIWASRAGMREIELSFNFSGKPSSIRLPHLYYINQVRLAIEAKRPNDHWKSERQIRKDTPASVKGTSQPHTPDALLTNAMNGKVTAIEVECHAKTDDELADDLRELAVTYRSVWYFTTSSTRRQIKNMLEKDFTPEMRKPFVLYDLEDYGHEYRTS
ncbi:hypothetical protein KSF_015970 [Reticulibacter mediterranei]|uniref:Uncharacterized protein n=1 Tax=Reticulibacter mediterranei TaxID=2778369 RepID=A0A8J3IHR9_9CHLR|nr:hypothetical protein [Reticulibacter mediterranei]GHO91549.1 hypothetical protein KSF_015970 [Reticulibacter mediterranei]